MEDAFASAEDEKARRREKVLEHVKAQHAAEVREAEARLASTRAAEEAERAAAAAAAAAGALVDATGNALMASRASPRSLARRHIGRTDKSSTRASARAFFKRTRVQKEHSKVSHYECSQTRDVYFIYIVNLSAIHVSNVWI